MRDFPAVGLWFLNGAYDPNWTFVYSVANGSNEPTLINAAMSIKDREMLFADIQRSRG
jgi:hypothetical protein